MIEIKTKYRFEWWVNGRKKVRTFGSVKQGNKYIEKNEPNALNISHRAFQERDNHAIR